jgi:hypothetical protein
MILRTGFRSRSSKKIVSGAAAVTVAVAMMTTLSPAAEATSAPFPARGVEARTVFVVPAGGTVSTTIGGAHIKAVGSATLAASCTFTVYTPFRYYGGTYGGGEEGGAIIQCTTSVTQLFIEVGLFKNNVQVTYNSNTSNYSSFVNAYTEYPVSAGYYYTGAQGTTNSNGITSTVPYKTSSTVYLS